MLVSGRLNKKCPAQNFFLCGPADKRKPAGFFSAYPDIQETGLKANRLRAIFRSGIDKDGKSEFESCCVEVAVGNSNLHKVARDAIK